MPEAVEILLENDGRNRLIINIQRERPLKLKGISAIKIFSQGSKVKNALFDTYFHDESGNIYNGCKLQLETLNQLPLNTTIHNGTITYEGFQETFTVDTEAVDYPRFYELAPPLEEKIRKKMDLSEKGLEAFAVCKTENYHVLLPSMAIGAFFYFPNTYIRRSFFKQDIANIMHTEYSSCKHHSVCLKSGVRFDETTVLLAHLYRCNNYSRAYFYNAFSYFIKSKIKNTTKNPCISYATFKFPLKGRVCFVFRGEYLDEKHFLAYEIVNAGLADILGTNVMNGFYEGKKPSPVRAGIFRKSKGHAGSLSHTAPYNSRFTEEYLDISKSDDAVSDVIVKKQPAMATGQESCAFSTHSETRSCEGASLGSERDEFSSHAKAAVNTLRFDFKQAVEHLKNRLKSWGNNYNLTETAEYFSFSFNYKKRYCQVVELKIFESSTLVFSSKRNFDADWLAENIIAVKKGESYYRGYIAFGKFLKSRKDICFHPAQKHTGEDLSGWTARIVEKLDKPEKCRGEVTPGVPRLGYNNLNRIEE